MDRRIIKTKKAIREAFSALIKEKTIQDITISELSQKADIDRRTFYLHYNTITDIITEIEEEAIQDLNKEIATQTDFKLDSFFECLNGILMSNFDYYQCITSKSSYYRFQIECKNILKDAITKNFYKESGLTKTDFDFYSEYVTAGIMAIYIQWANNKNRCDIKELSIKAASAVKDSWQKITNKIH